MSIHHRPRESDIDRASMRIAAGTLRPTFAGGVFEFARDDLSSGEWLPPRCERPAAAGLTVYVPRLATEPFALRQARCRILIEDALRELTA